MNPGIRRLAILGGGSWGTALAIALASNFPEVRLWMHDAELALEVRRTRENARYLPGFALASNICVSADPEHALADAHAILIAIPSQHLRSVLQGLRSLIPADAIVISTTKGLEPESRLCMSEVIATAAGIESGRLLALSGPSFAAEVASGLPTAVVVAGPNAPARAIQSAFRCTGLRIYTSEDLKGVEIGGALKNVVAIGAGMAAGLQLGHNAIAALITRGLAEITRLGTSAGADPRTLAGLAGLGDLVLTCTSDLSRNRHIGFVLSCSHSVRSVLQTNSKTAEGLRTAGVAVELGQVFNVEMPIAEQVRSVLESRISPRAAIRQLMERSLKEEYA